MVCLVHDRRYLSRFHATVNRLRDTKQFSVFTLRALPRLCCSCTAKYNSSTSSKVEPLIESIDFDVLQMACLKLNFERCLQHQIKSSTSPIRTYAILSFTNLSDSINRISLAIEYISQRTCWVSLNFITSDSSLELLHTAIQYQYDLVKQCSTYTEVQQNVDGLWVIITGINQTEIDAMKSTVENDWQQFLHYANARLNYTKYRAPKSCYPLLTVDTCLSTHPRKITQEIRVKKEHSRAAKRQQQQLETMYLKRTYKSSDDWLPEEDLADEENALPNLNTCLRYLHAKCESSRKGRRTRIHRRKNILALGLLA